MMILIVLIVYARVGENEGGNDLFSEFGEETK